MPNYQFQYRVGYTCCYSKQQWDQTEQELEQEQGKSFSTNEWFKRIRLLPPDHYQYEVYGVIVETETDRVVKITKHSCGIMVHTSEEEMRKDIELYAASLSHPYFARDNFGCVDYLVINSDELTPDIIRGAIQELVEEKKENGT